MFTMPSMLFQAATRLVCSDRRHNLRDGDKGGRDRGLKRAEEEARGDEALEVLCGDHAAQHGAPSRAPCTR